MKIVVNCACCALAIAIVAGHYQPAAALLVAPPSSNDNTSISSPDDDPGWANVGDRGVYLGNRWVITANHVGSGATTFTGIGTFNAVPGSDQRVPNPLGLGLTTHTDLLLYRLSTDPGLPAISLAAVTPAPGALVTLIGDGLSALPDAVETHWRISGDDPNYTWEAGLGDDASGFYGSDSRKLWGTNLVEDAESEFHEGDDNNTVAVTLGDAKIISFFTRFDKVGVTNGTPTDHEAQALSGDSGSAVFQKVDGSWVLVGISYAIGVFEDQPDVGTTAVYGNLTFAADIASYRNQILSIASIPEISSFVLVGSTWIVLLFLHFVTHGWR